MALIDENDLLGAILEKEYGQSQSQDTHIDYFYLVLRGELVEKRDKIKILDQLKKIGEWTYDRTDWPEFMVGKFPKVAPSETERHHQTAATTDTVSRLQQNTRDIPSHTPTKPTRITTHHHRPCLQVQQRS